MKVILSSCIIFVASTFGLVYFTEQEEQLIYCIEQPKKHITTCYNCDENEDLFCLRLEHCPEGNHCSAKRQ